MPDLRAVPTLPPRPSRRVRTIRQTRMDWRWKPTPAETVQAFCWAHFRRLIAAALMVVILALAAAFVTYALLTPTGLLDPRRAAPMRARP